MHPAWRRTRRLQKFKEGGKNITFLNFDGTYGDTNKVLHFIQQFDAAFGGEHFTEGSKLRHVAMYFQKSARHWWATLRAQELAPKTWKECRSAIMKQFLPKGAKDEVLTAWRSFKLEEGESIQKYIDKFWDLHLKATVFSKIEFSEQKQQFSAGLPEDMRAYVNAQSPKSISAMIHHSIVAAKIFLSGATKMGVRASERKERPTNGEKPSSNANRGKGEKKKDKGLYKGKNRLSPEEMERYRKENRCYKCGEQGHAYRACPLRTAKNGKPQASRIATQDKIKEADASSSFILSCVAILDACGLSFLAVLKGQARYA